MQAVYLHAITGRAAGDPAFGWLKIGGQGDVPKQASYVGQFADVYVWVMPEGIEGLSDLALAILDVATSEDTGGTQRRAHACDARSHRSTAAQFSGSRGRAGVYSRRSLKTDGSHWTCSNTTWRPSIDSAGRRAVFFREFPAVSGQDGEPSRGLGQEAPGALQ